MGYVFQIWVAVCTGRFVSVKRRHFPCFPLYFTNIPLFHAGLASYLTTCLRRMKIPAYRPIGVQWLNHYSLLSRSTWPPAGTSTNSSSGKSHCCQFQNKNCGIRVFSVYVLPRCGSVILHVRQNMYSSIFKPVYL